MILQVCESLALVGGHVVCMPDSTLACPQSLSPSQLADLRLAASQLSGPTRRALKAEMTLQYYRGNPLLAATRFGGGRHTVALGLAERRRGIICLGPPSACSSSITRPPIASLIPSSGGGGFEK